jgi:hypothetical protein
VRRERDGQFEFPVRHGITRGIRDAAVIAQLCRTDTSLLSESEVQCDDGKVCQIVTNRTLMIDFAIAPNWIDVSRIATSRLIARKLEFHKKKAGAPARQSIVLLLW